MSAGVMRGMGGWVRGVSSQRGGGGGGECGGGYVLFF